MVYGGGGGGQKVFKSSAFVQTLELRLELIPSCQNYGHLRKQTQLAVPHLEIQVELD